MPLAFESLSHGTIAFGFFNIDSDMLLLEKYFLFATDFCRHIGELVETFDKNLIESRWQVYYIAEPAQIGDLSGAIHGVRFTGFIGELYRKFPFPQSTENFKQKPEGIQSQAVVRDIISRYACQIHIPIAVDKKAFEIGIGEYKFNRRIFGELVKYVWRGGYPGWKDEIRPDYVLAMKDAIERHGQGLFDKIVFD